MGHTQENRAGVSVGLLLLGLIVMGMGLCLAVSGFTWGTGENDDWSMRWGSMVWRYVQLAWGICWFLVWPGWRMRGAESCGGEFRKQMIYDFNVVLIAAVPAVMIGSWFLASELQGWNWWRQVISCVILQGANGILAWGIMVRTKGSRWGITAMVWWWLGGAIAAYVQAEFFPGLGKIWWHIFPALTIWNATTPGIQWNQLGVEVGVGLCYAIVGVWLLGKTSTKLNHG